MRKNIWRKQSTCGGTEWQINHDRATMNRPVAKNILFVVCLLMGQFVCSRSSSQHSPETGMNRNLNLTIPRVSTVRYVPANWICAVWAFLAVLYFLFPCWWRDTVCLSRFGPLTIRMDGMDEWKVSRWIFGFANYSQRLLRGIQPNLKLRAFADQSFDCQIYDDDETMLMGNQLCMKFLLGQQGYDVCTFYECL